MIKIGIFGGAFNPIHKGHVNMANEAFADLKLDKMLIIPTGNPPHKNCPEVSFEDRMEMCRLAFNENAKFEISDIEGKSSKKSYTINTVRALKKKYPENTMFYLLIGGDMLFYFEKWYRYEALLGECKVVAVARENSEYSDMVEYASEIGRIKVLNLSVTEVSSTEIREKIFTGSDVSGLVPEKVLEYIEEKKLYNIL